jgi:hypothetical protein
MRPTNGEISWTLASAQATAWANGEEEGEVAADAFLFEFGGGLDAFPGGGHLHETRSREIPAFS